MTTQESFVSSLAAPREPWHDPWQADALEKVDACPVCANPVRSCWHEGLVDNTFRTAAGTWALWRCAACSSGYLSPRPTADSIAQAYGSYYTHRVSPNVPQPMSWRQRLGLGLANGYTNWRYGARLEPASVWGVLACTLVSAWRRGRDRQYRHLPAAPVGGGTLLDVGCGDGSFLALAEQCGWRVQGLEPDPKAAAAAAQRGLQIVQGGLECLRGHSDVFDVITLSHVIEHVHDPLQTLQACHRLLKPGGRLWLETPNVNSMGHRLFGKNWRGLEAPRHLVLFSQQALVHALEQAGFCALTALPVPGSRRWMFERSLSMLVGRWPEDPATLPRWLGLQAWWSDRRDASRDGQREFLTMGAHKPS